jgi:hypothetical protein
MHRRCFIQQLIYLNIGTYVFSTYFISIKGTENNPIQVSINDEILTTINQVANTWILFTHTFNILEAGNKLLRLEGLSQGDLTTGIDLVALSDDPMNSNFDNLLENISNKIPYAYFRATDYEEDTGYIPAQIGDFTATIDGVGFTLDNGSGNGANASIPFLIGTVDSIVNFNVNIPATFTVCSITRYTGNTNTRIIEAEEDNWFHGHWNNVRV